MKPIIFFVFIGLLCACGSTYVVHDYDEKQDFSVYKTYNFYPEMNSGLSELDQKRLLSVTDLLMKNKGFTWSENPEIYVNFKSVITKEASGNSIGVGVGSGGGRGVNVGIGGNIPIGTNTYLELTIDFVDVQKDELVWQAVAKKRFYPNASPNTKTDLFEKMVKKSLEKYPPEKKN